jgi:glycosyltransferase 2 family protein
VISRLRASRALRIGLVLVALAFCAYGLASRWSDTRAAITELSWPSLAAAFVAGVAGLFAWMLGWRALLTGLGSPLPLRAAIRVYFVAQLGKYIPGSVWALVGQMELAREHHVPRERGASAALLAMATTVATGCAVAAVTLPLTSASATHRYWWLLLAAPIFLGALHPRVVGFALGRALRLLKRPPLEQLVGGRTMVVAVFWTALGWLLLGVHTWVITWAAGGKGSGLLFLATGAYALAFTAGFLVVIAPGGAGVREAALVIALGPVVKAPLVIALASRVVMTLADLLWAAAAAILHRGSAPAEPQNTTTG